MKPRISVVIAAYNEEKLIGKCIKALQKQTYPKDKFEIIIVDNGSYDRTKLVCEKMGVEVYLYTELQGCGPSREFGAIKARGSIVAFTDADSVISADWLAKIDELLIDPKTQMVSGHALPDKKTVIINLVFSFCHWFFLLNNLLGKPLIWGANMAVKKSAYDAVGGINIQLPSSEDWDLSIRIQKRFGEKSVRYFSELQVVTSTRKYTDLQVFSQYAIDGIRNYIDLVILGKEKAIPVFNVR